MKTYFVLIWFLTSLSGVLSGRCSVSKYWKMANMKCNELFNDDLRLIPPQTIGIKLILENTVKLDEFNFTGIQNISRLEIFAKRLSSIHENTFARFTSLTSLTIENTDLQELSGNIFLPLKNLKSLYIQKNRRLYRLNDLALSELKKLTTLFLTQNNFETLDPKTFDNLSKLQSLDLRANKLSYIDKSLFSNLRNLKSLVIDGNRIKSLHRQTFSRLVELRVLCVIDNKLDCITSFLFKELANLIELHLGKNLIYFLPRNSLVGLKRLKRMYLYNNKLKEIQSAEFSGLKNLRLLDLSYNELKEFDENHTSFNLTGLSSLNLNNNHLKMLNKRMMLGSIQLQSFDANNNPIESIDGDTFGDLSYLRHVSLKNCKIRYLPGKLFRRPSRNFRLLFLSKNEIKFLDRSLMSNLQNLQNLDLSHNIGLNLTGFHLQMLSKLYKIKLANISLTSIPTNISFYLRLVSDVQLQDNLLTNFGSFEFCNMAYLIRFNISGNKFRTIHSGQFSCFSGHRKKCKGSMVCYIDYRNNPIQCTLYFMNVYQNLSQGIHVHADCVFKESRHDASSLNQELLTPNWTARHPSIQNDLWFLEVQYTRQFYLVLDFSCSTDCRETIYVTKYDLETKQRVNILSIEIASILTVCFDSYTILKLSCYKKDLAVDRTNYVEISQRSYRNDMLYLTVFLNGEEVITYENQTFDVYKNFNLTVGNNNSNNIQFEKFILYSENTWMANTKESRDTIWQNTLLLIAVIIVLVIIGISAMSYLFKGNVSNT